MLDALQRWLPTGSYRFVGGPKDGHTLAVDLRETERGLVPPEFWRVDEQPRSTKEAMHMAYTDTVRVYTYRFVASGFNTGHYEYLP